jgi:hypothetical protein
MSAIEAIIIKNINNVTIIKSKEVKRKRRKVYDRFNHYIDINGDIKKKNILRFCDVCIHQFRVKSNFYPLESSTCKWCLDKMFNIESYCIECKEFLCVSKFTVYRAKRGQGLSYSSYCNQCSLATL